MARAEHDLDALYRRHRDDVLRFFVRRTGEAEVALDLWAETFAQAVRTARRCRAADDDGRERWLYGIARNQLAFYLRRGYAEQRAVRRLKIERPQPSDAFLREVERRADLPAIRREIAGALTQLPEGTRRAVQLRIVDELSYEEVATRLETTEVAARARVSRGLQRLADLLDPTLLDEVTA